MPGNRFQQELDKLESLLDNLNGPSISRKSRSRSPVRGGAKKASKSPRKVAKKSKSPRKASKSPRKASKSPRKVAKKSKSPRKASRSPKRKASKSPRKAAKKSKSPRKASKSPRKAAKKSKSPRKASRSPKRKMRGGKSRSPSADGDRHFKLVEVSGKSVDDDGRYNLPATTSKGKPQKRGPKEMASKAFTQLCKKHKRGDECHFKFAIQETTRGSNRKVYHYEGKRVKLAKVESYKVAGGKTIVRKYRNELKSLGSSAEQSQKGGWVFYN